MDYLEFFRSSYEKESERRAQLSAQLPIPVGIFTVIGGGFYGMVQGLHLPLRGLEVATAILLTGVVVCAVGADWYLVCFQFGHKYRYLPSPQAIDDYRAKLSAHYATQGRYGAIVEDELETNLERNYINYATWNSIRNDRKTQYLYKTNSWLAVCGLFALAASVPYSLSKMKPAEPDRTLTVSVPIP